MTRMVKMGYCMLSIMDAVVLSGGHLNMGDLKEHISGYSSVNQRTMDRELYKRIWMENGQITKSTGLLADLGYLYVRRRPGMSKQKPMTGVYLTEYAIERGKDWGLEIDQDGTPILPHWEGNPRTITTYKPNFMVDAEYDMRDEEEE